MSFTPAPWPRKLRSQHWYGGNSRDTIYHRGWLKNQGYPHDLFDGRPVIGIMNTWADLTPCNGHLRELAEKVKAGVWEAGGFPVEVPVFSASENTYRPTAMMYRNLAAMAVEEAMRGQPIDGAVLMVVFVAWLAATLAEVCKQRRNATEEIGELRHGRALFSCIGGMAALVAAGTLIVTGARGVAAAFGIDEFIVGATLVAIGTSTPELATTIVAKLRGHDEVGLGTILGSNIFNNLFIVAVAAMIHPISVAWREVAVALGFGIVALAFCYPPRDGMIGRGRGLLLLAVYVAYNATLFQ